MTSITPEIINGIPRCAVRCPAYIRIGVLHPEIYCEQQPDMRWPLGKVCLPAVRALAAKVADMEAELEGTRAARDTYWDELVEKRGGG